MWEHVLGKVDRDFGLMSLGASLSCIAIPTERAYAHMSCNIL